MRTLKLLVRPTNPRTIAGRLELKRAARMEGQKQSGPEPHWLQRVVIGRNPYFTLVRVLILVVTCVIVFKFVLLPIRVEGVSMLPTYKNGRINFVNRLAYLWHEPERGDVVAIRLAGPSVMYMKRIIGKPGETVAFHDGRTFINGKLLDEPYVKMEWFWELAPRQLGDDEYYFVGDNRSMPLLDHEQGKAHRYRIIGKVLL
jgi:signal peptidase I